MKKLSLIVILLISASSYYIPQSALYFQDKTDIIHFIEENPDIFGDVSSVHLQYEETKLIDNKIFALAVPYHNRYRIWDNNYGIRVFKQNEQEYHIWAIRGNFESKPFGGNRSLDRTQIVKQLQNYFGSQSDSIEYSEILYSPTENSFRLSHYLIYRLTSDRRLAVFIDAENGKILDYVNTVMYQSSITGNAGIMFYPRFSTDDMLEGVFSNGMVFNTDYGSIYNYTDEWGFYTIGFP